MVYDNYTEAEAAVKEPIEGFEYVFRYSKGEKDYYHCKGFIKCPKELFLLRHDDSLEVSMYLCDSREHQHETKRGTLPAQSKSKVLELVSNGVRDNALIRNVLIKANLPCLKFAQMNRLKSLQTTKLFGKPTDSLNELQTWCKERANIPEDMDEVFCGDFSYELNPDDSIDKLRIFVTTKRLIGQTRYGKIINYIIK